MSQAVTLNGETGPEENEVVVHCEGLVKIFKANDLEVFALQGLDLTIRQGEVMAIIGASGSGKSTLLNILGGLDTPSAGRCHVGEYNLLKMSETERVRYKREMVGFVWQNNARNLIPYLTALENVMLPMALNGNQEQSRAVELLTAVGLAERMAHKVTSLSGGEQQRVAIALSLANRPRLLLADEPTGSVDTKTALVILEIFRNMSALYGTTVIIVTHDQLVAEAVDRVVHIRDGKIGTEAIRRFEIVDTETGQEERAVLEEHVVVDSVGRLQIPPDLLVASGLKGKVKLALEDGKIVLVPVNSDERQEGAKRL